MSKWIAILLLFFTFINVGMDQRRDIAIELGDSDYRNLVENEDPHNDSEKILLVFVILIIVYLGSQMNPNTAH